MGAVWLGKNHGFLKQEVLDQRGLVHCLSVWSLTSYWNSYSYTGAMASAKSEEKKDELVG